MTRPLTQPDSPEACFAVMAEQAHSLGFEFCAFGMRMPMPITRPRTIYYSNYPAAWKARYREAGYLDIDPCIQQGMRSSSPLLWDDHLFAETPQLWREAQAHGLRHGWQQSRRDAEGFFSLLVLARSSGAIQPEELAEKEQRMQWLVQWSHSAMMQACDDSGVRPQKVELSAREIEVLRWTAEGKTAAEIASIIDLSERTVNFHINNVVAKLGASNKTNAAVRATLLGLIW